MPSPQRGPGNALAMSARSSSQQNPDTTWWCVGLEFGFGLSPQSSHAKEHADPLDDWLVSEGLRGRANLAHPLWTEPRVNLVPVFGPVLFNAEYEFDGCLVRGSTRSRKLDEEHERERELPAPARVIR